MLAKAKAKAKVGSGVGVRGKLWHWHWLWEETLALALAGRTSLRCQPRARLRLGLARFRADEIAKFLDDLVAASTRHAQVKSLRPVSSDPDDDILIELAITADVQVLVTHNVRHFSKVPGLGIDLLTPGQLLQKCRT